MRNGMRSGVAHALIDTPVHFQPEMTMRPDDVLMRIEPSLGFPVLPEVPENKKLLLLRRGK